MPAQDDSYVRRFQRQSQFSSPAVPRARRRLPPHHPTRSQLEVSPDIDAHVMKPLPLHLRQSEVTVTRQRPEASRAHRDTSIKCRTAPMKRPSAYARNRAAEVKARVASLDMPKASAYAKMHKRQEGYVQQRKAQKMATLYSRVSALESVPGAKDVPLPADVRPPADLNLRQAMVGEYPGTSRGIPTRLGLSVQDLPREEIDTLIGLSAQADSLCSAIPVTLDRIEGLRHKLDQLTAARGCIYQSCQLDMPKTLPQTRKARQEMKALLSEGGDRSEGEGARPDYSSMSGPALLRERMGRGDIKEYAHRLCHLEAILRRATTEQRQALRQERGAIDMLPGHVSSRARGETEEGEGEGGETPGERRRVARNRRLANTPNTVSDQEHRRLLSQQLAAQERESAMYGRMRQPTIAVTRPILGTVRAHIQE
ncbi:hypothetical protein KIPB_003775 [Kipferlia bialata]|uniref:Uncharacterized protein n=1 Tax=Kipferlia bialata TaxID=797122 RepID=A0A9K3CUE3_9EUKA|nr:hypothetical protein KIPB_000805 [Kipferlia bialata]GIQ82610.1 hypothetical protein KIPB_003775 [Kipferlia bialata]|eukprot:g805.t1